MNSQPLIISLEGNIGSGKSTLMKYLEENLDEFLNLNKFNKKVCFLQEPVSSWSNIIDESDGKNVIQKFYENNAKYAFAFQMMAYISRLALFRKALNENYDIIFTERSMYTDRNIFAKMLYETGDIGSIEYQIYNTWFDEFTDCLQNMKIVYVITEPNTCYQRIVKRDRDGETIPLDYLTNCHEHHESWLNSDNFTPTNKLQIDGNIDIKTDDKKFDSSKHYADIMEQIFHFITF
tara:strand:+ start:493 stop:1197 length:705 start_codon:yes stop_codon:yes gene_type:complete